MFNKATLRKFMPLFVIAILATLLIAQSFAAAPQQDADGNYLLGTKADLEWFRDQVNSGNNAINAKLTADIDLECSATNEWVPIGRGTEYDTTTYKYAPSYNGVFDGAGFEVSGLYINSNAGQNREHVGLFGYADSAKIKNLTVSGEITAIGKCTSEYSGNVLYAGGICGGADSTTFENCVSNVKMNSALPSGYSEINYRHFGGICAHASECELKNCINNGAIVVSGSVSEHGEIRVGGICYSANGGSLSNCLNAGDITVSDCGYSNYVAGIIASTRPYHGEKVVISNCVNKGNITDKSASTDYNLYAAGIVAHCDCEGNNAQVQITNCVNEGAVSAQVGVSGGIVADVHTNEGTTGFVYSLSNSVNTGTVSNTNGVKGAVCGRIRPSSGEIKLTAGYLSAVCDNPIGKIEEGEGTVTKTITEYTETNLPAMAAIVPVNGTVKTNATSEVATIYPEKAVNKDSVKVTVSSEDTNIAVSGGNNLVKGVKTGTTTLTCEITELPNQSETITMSQKVTVEEGEDPEPTPSSGGGGGGCNAGFGALALIMALPMFYRRKK